MKPVKISIYTFMMIYLWVKELFCFQVVSVLGNLGGLLGLYLGLSVLSLVELIDLVFDMFNQTTLRLDIKKYKRLKQLKEEDGLIETCTESLSLSNGREDTLSRRDERALSADPLQEPIEELLL